MFACFFSSFSLSRADLSVGLFNVLVDISWRITVSWEAGNLACKIIKFIQCMTTYASTYVLVALSIDRYDAITHPMNFSNCCELNFKSSLLGWICILCRDLIGHFVIFIIILLSTSLETHHREASKAAGVRRLDAQRPVLRATILSLRGSCNSRRHAMLDWSRRADILAALHEHRVDSAFLHSRHHHYALLCDNRENNLG